MEECGIRGPLSKWFQSYLTNRTLRTRIGEQIGQEAAIKYGVPTGSVYGPVGYIMHVNSMIKVIKNCSVYMYADDTCMMYAGTDMDVIEKHMQIDFENVIKWSHDNGIILNVAKTKCMLLHSPHIKKPTRDLSIIGHSYECLHNDKQVCVNCNHIDFVNHYKYLGLTIDHKFSWRLHIDNVCNKLRSVLCKFKQLRYLTNRRILYVLYHALVDSLLSYGLISYGRTFKTYLDKISSIQTRFLKEMVAKNVKNKCNKNYMKLYKICNVLPVHEKVKYLLIVEQYGKSEFKTPKHGMLRKAVRNKYLEPTARNYYGERTHMYIIPRLFNKMSIEEDEMSIDVFKNKVKQLLLCAYDEKINM